MTQIRAQALLRPANRLAGDDPQDWREDAACRDEDPEMFFPMGSGAVVDMQVKQAKAMCADCPVRQACLAWSLDTRQQWGIWGGLNEDQRRTIIRRRNRYRKETEK